MFAYRCGGEKKNITKANRSQTEPKYMPKPFDSKFCQPK